MAHINLGKFKKHYLRVSIGIVYLWFGALKFFPHVSPAEDLALNTINELTNYLLPANVALILLAIWEVTVGLLLLCNWQKKMVTSLAIVHMLLTFTPIYFFPELIFNGHLFALTLLGQYIIKNLIILGALGILWLEAREETEKVQKTVANGSLQSAEKTKSVQKLPLHTAKKLVLSLLTR